MTPHAEWPIVAASVDAVVPGFSGSEPVPVVPEDAGLLNYLENGSAAFQFLTISMDIARNCNAADRPSLPLPTQHLQFGWVYAFPALIALSCVFTKQHYVIDLPTGAGLG